MCATATNSSALSRVPDPFSVKSPSFLFPHLPATVSTALRAFGKDLLEKICTALFSHALPIIAAKNCWWRSTRLAGRRTGLSTRPDKYKMQKRSQIVGHFSMTCNAKIISSESESGFAMVSIPPSIPTGSVVRSSSSAEKGIAVLEYAFKRYTQIYECTKTTPVSASEEKLHSVLFLNGTVQPVLTDLPLAFVGKETQRTLRKKSSRSLK